MLVSGSVEELSDVVARQTGLQRGDSVMALVGGGGYAGQLYTCTHNRYIKLCITCVVGWCSP